MAKKPKHFVVNLKAAHDEQGLSPYMVAKQTGIAINTVVRYTSNEKTVIKQLEVPLLILLNHYGLDWRDPTVIKVVYEDDTQEERKTLLQAV